MFAYQTTPRDDMSVITALLELVEALSSEHQAEQLAALADNEL